MCTRNLTGRFGSESYAREELRAQMASLFMSAELGVPFNPDRHAAYQASWVKALQDDKHEIFRAARDAEAMASYVIGLAQSPTKDAAAPQVEPPQDASAMISAPVVTADAAAAPAVSGGISSERAEQLVAQFLAEYKGFGADGRFPLKIAVLHTERDFHELYGPHADAVIQAFADPARKACVHPSRGLLVLHAGHHRDEEDFNRSLAHEGNGHSGLPTFTPEQKRAVLDALIGARGSRGLIGEWWRSVDQSEEYGSKSLEQRASLDALHTWPGDVLRGCRTIMATDQTAFSRSIG
ncbi:zincin-like metallopeptidase domain-containing protein [Sphaerotilus mobilis]|uniref:zincin-like metallopeptidase domain-containing protein n=1 Tax=Sphaerotilus mobilis TaxID=47994 RepID=UPI001F5E6362|nr:zincin-like metallopeptidase domain-containing protein [Sphaerotilus mobilis]